MAIFNSYVIFWGSLDAYSLVLEEITMTSQGYIPCLYPLRQVVAGSS